MSDLTVNLAQVATSPNFPSDGVAFAASGSHAWISTDAGATWALLGANVVGAAITVIEFSPDFANDRNVYVGTQDSGIWVYTVPA